MNRYREIKLWNHLAQIYDNIMKNQQHMYKRIIGYIREEVHANDILLEGAAGTGVIGLALKKYVKRIELCDFSPQMIRVIKNKIAKQHISNVHCSVQDLCDLKYPKNCFDKVILANVLHVMKEPEKALSCVKKVLKKDGILIAPTYVHKNRGIVGDGFAIIMRLIGIKIYHKWTYETYIDFLEKNGFIIKRIECLRGVFPVLYVVATVN